jgi:signal transduction histidine kinase
MVMAGVRSRPWERLGITKRDVAVAAGVGLIQIVGTTFAGHRQPSRDALDALAYTLLAIGPVALLVRRRFPVTVLYVTLAATLAYVSLDYPRGPIFLSLIVAFATAVLHGRRLWAYAALPVGFVAFLWVPYLTGSEAAPTAAGAAARAAWLGFLAAAAEIVRVRRERVAETVRNRKEEERRRATEERLRIARDLHDVLGHNISLINVQAGVALHLMDQRPEQARTALAAIKEASAETLREMRAVLGVLRQADEEAPRSPAPSVARLDDLVSRAGVAGIWVSTEVRGEARALPSGVDLAAFRIVQEALTNVTKHAGPAAARVRLTYGDRDLEVQIDDDGRGSNGELDRRDSSGIRGMRERAEALGGELAAGPRPEGGFRVRARLPLEDDR